MLEAVDRRARALKISRNRLIVLALEKALAEGSEWSAGFFEELEHTDPAHARAVGEMLHEVRARRSSKKAPEL